MPNAHQLAVALFSGQGNPAGQMAELRRVAALPCVLAFLTSVSQSLMVDIEGLNEAAVTQHLGAGMCIGAWADGTCTPSLEYLNSLPVTLVLTFVIQLATFRYCWARGATADGAVGHSQGLAAAMVVSLAADEEEYVAFASAFARVLLHFGLATAEVVRTSSCKARLAEPASQSFALAVLKLGADEVQHQVHTHNEARGAVAAEAKCHVVVFNGAEALTVTGPPPSLVALERRIVDWAAHHGRAISTKVLPVHAPFHCAAWLGAASEQVLERVARSPPLLSTRLRRPLWSCVDGTELRRVSSVEPTELQAYLVRALAVEPVRWPQTISAVATHTFATHAVADPAVATPAVATHGVEASTPPAAAAPAVALTLVDYGPGGSSGAMRVSQVVARELGVEHLRFEYFTQRHVPGPLPGSWLEWVRSAEESCRPRVSLELAATSARAVHVRIRLLVGEDDSSPSPPPPRLQLPPPPPPPPPQPQPQPPQPLQQQPPLALRHEPPPQAVTPPRPPPPGPGTKAARGFCFFSERVKRASGHATSPIFSAVVLEAIRLELDKVDHGRYLSRQRAYSPSISRQLQSAAYARLVQQAVRTFDTERYPLRRLFCELLGLGGVPADLPLERLHARYHADGGGRRARAEKAALLRPLTEPLSRCALLATYERLVLEVLAPMVADAMGCERVVFQSFPCVRVHRPGEFSIGPHCDAQYQLPDGNLNVYLPLTSIRDTNSLYLESAPGREDFRPLRLDYGELATFYGAFCTHFALENLTQVTRVSLDFRVVPGCCYEVGPEDQPRDFLVGEYYSECTREAGRAGAFLITTRGHPYWRHGFPHTNS